MFKNVIVGVDGRQGGRDATALGKQLVATDGRLALVYVQLGDLSSVAGSGAGFEPAERERALGLLTAARDESGSDARLLLKRSPSAGRGLHELAESEHADLLVVGSTSHGLIGRVLIGDDTRGALNGAPCAVAIAPAGYSERATSLGEIGVGYNGSPESQHALAIARELAESRGARVSTFEATSGAAAEELALYGTDVDLLIIGSRGYGPLGRIVHGSVSEHLARTARCPLLVLTRGAREHDADSEPRPAADAPPS